MQMSKLSKILSGKNSEKNSEKNLWGSILMVDPEFFNIEYAINPHMQDAQGKLKQVDKGLARRQWETLRQTLLDLGIEVSILKGVARLPDMVFAANQSWPFRHPQTRRPSVLLARMRSEFRQPEVEFFESFYRSKNYDIYHLEDRTLFFEGNGDALLHPGQNLVWCGVGPRTEEKAYQEISGRFGFQTQILHLRDPHFYHLDTCFSILSPTTVAIVKGVFEPNDESSIRRHFESVIEISEAEALQHFAGNCFSFDGRHVILQSGASEFEADLRRHGFIPVPLETSEFIKSGGSVFCMKMWLPL